MAKNKLLCLSNLDSNIGKNTQSKNIKMKVKK